MNNKDPSYLLLSQKLSGPEIIHLIYCQQQVALHAYTKTLQWDKILSLAKIMYPDRFTKHYIVSPDYFQRWCEAVKFRDGDICQKCHSEQDLVAHIIDPRGQCTKNNDLPVIFTLQNGITLCARCHEIYHVIFKTDINLKTLNKFLERDL